MEDFEVLADALAQSRAEAPELWAELWSYRFEDQYHLIRLHRRFVTWGLCELFCRESVRLALIDPERAVESAELAVLVSDLLKEDDSIRAGRLYQLRGYAWAHDGNARRVLGDLRNAEESFVIADAWWEAGAGLGDVFGYESMFLELKSSVRIAQRRFTEAFEMLDRMYAIHTGGCREEHKDVHLAGRTLLKKALALAEMGEPEQAIGLLQRAEPLIDPERDSRLFLCLRHNLLWNLTSIEAYGEARTMLPEIEALCRELGNPLDRVRLSWAEARIAAGLGETEAATQLFETLRQDFAARGIAYDAALVTLELTALYARAGSVEDVKRLSLEMASIFQAQDVPREALAALLFFQKAAERERATAKLAREIGVFLEKLRREPGLRFERLR
jgi:tetratricopeptide (TPR) repeat protein